MFYAAVIFVILALADRLLLGPFLSKKEDIENKIAQQKMTVTNDLKFLSHKNKIEKQDKDLRKYYVEKVTDEHVINAEFLSLVEKLATQSQVVLVKSNPSESKKEKDHIKYFANLDCVGELENVIGFMHAINSTDELLKIDRFSLAPKKGGTPNEVNASMTIVKLVVVPNTAQWQ